MKIFGIGLNKTGTKTLASCLRSLGYDHQSYDEDLTLDFIAGRTDRVWDKADRHGGFEDWPWPLMYSDLAERYPDARFILTVRSSAEAWLHSLSRHATRVPPEEHVDRQIYGFRYPDTAPEKYLEFYDRHNREVLAKLGDRCLKVCWEDGDGWADLGRFLERGVPDEPMPHENPGWEIGRKARLMHHVRRKRERLQYKLGEMVGRTPAPFPLLYQHTDAI